MIPKNIIHVSEEHSATLPIWWALHDSPRTVVYLDAHLDLQETSVASVAALKHCTTLEEVRALEVPNHLNPSTRYAFGIENFLYAAHRLKLLDRLIWVAPAHIPRHYSSELIGYMQQMDGVTFDELTSFRTIGPGVLRGELLGLDITICDYDNVGSLDIDQNFYLDIDIDYFVDVPSDRLWIDPAIVINTILTELGDPSMVTISRAVSSGFTPMAFRYVGDYIYSLLSGQEREFAYYQKLTKAIRNLADGDLERGRHICEQLTKDQPELAAAYYILALSDGDLNAKNRLLNLARRYDAAYGFDLAREAIGLLHRKKPLSRDTVQRLAKSLDRLDLDKLHRQQAEVALAQVLAASGDLESALSLVARQEGDYANHEDVWLAIAARQLANSSVREQNAVLLTSISNGGRNATAAMVYLGDLDFAGKNFQPALNHYAAAHQRASAWMLPMERMLDCYQQLGMIDDAIDLEQRIVERRQRIEHILG